MNYRNYRWALRKLLLPVYGKGLVIDIGSGGRPHPFADIIIEKHTKDSHRYRKLASDGRLVLADALHLPFKNNAFSFSMAFHVLEHIAEPSRFLTEISRVSQSGYLETPNEVYEILNPISVHVNLVAIEDSELVIKRKKNDWMDSPGAFIRPSYNNKALKRNMRQHPELYHTTFSWKNNLNFRIDEDDELAPSWYDDSKGLTDTELLSHPSSKEYIIPKFIAVLSRLVRKRRKNLLSNIYACPKCKSDVIIKEYKFICTNDTCGGSYPALPVPDFRV